MKVGLIWPSLIMSIVKHVVSTGLVSYRLGSCWPPGAVPLLGLLSAAKSHASVRARAFVLHGLPILGRAIVFVYVFCVFDFFCLLP